MRTSYKIFRNLCIVIALVVTTVVDAEADGWISGEMAASYAGPTLISPAPGDLWMPLNGELRWQAVPGAGPYEVQVSSNRAFSSNTQTYSNIHGGSFSPPDLRGNSLYFWRVRGALDQREWSEIWDFMTEGVVPGPVRLSYVNVENIPLDHLIQWDRENNARWYHLQVATNPQFADPIFDDKVVGTGYSHEPSWQSSTRYYVRVRAENPAGSGPWSETGYFETIIMYPGGVFLYQPFDRATNVPRRPEFSWHPVPGALSYEIQTSVTSLFGSGQNIVEGIMDTTYTYPEYYLPNNRMYWRVRAVFDEGPGIWSVTRSFTTIGRLTSTDSEKPDVPESSKLLPNYPNPFNPSTTIPFELAQNGSVQIRVYDLTGRLLATLANGDFPAGYHDVPFDASRLGSGIYFVRMDTADGQFGRSITLVK